jgi:hypothetical protein
VIAIALTLPHQGRSISAIIPAHGGNFTNRTCELSNGAHGDQMSIVRQVTASLIRTPCRRIGFFCGFAGSVGLDTRVEKNAFPFNYLDSLLKNRRSETASRASALKSQCVTGLRQYETAVGRMGRSSLSLAQACNKQDGTERDTRLW